MTTPALSPEARAARRAEVRRLADQNMSHRAIATKLGISKDTVRRDLAHLARHEPAPPRETPAPEPRSPRTTLSEQAERAGAAMHQLVAAVAAVVEASVPYAMVDDQVAHDWAAQMRQACDTLRHERQQFADYYPSALIAGATMSHRRAPDETPAQSTGSPAPSTPQKGR
ncbi:hypothetical protein ACFCXP_11260 [Streptomyces niveus]|uniref:hypothetical protein n=1 Tax=Streptomyces niveus TaxID=193462 RepID=UPI0035E0583F